ncbi:MAG: hypothetical protein AMK70_07650 [Nitrospira bacterium SG8_35_1]|nr:MAG: hypothetical protein AMK70_07650 [Nitrospira bacterium SG8_35_1]
MGWKKIGLITAAAVSAAYLLLSIPVTDVVPVSGAGKTSFAWNQNQMWQALERRFREARSAGCPAVDQELQDRLQEGNRHRAMVEKGQFMPSDPLFNDLELNMFGLGPLIAACPERLPAYTELVISVRDAVKQASGNWDVSDRLVRDRLYRLLYGGRTALEEVILQAPEGSIPPIVFGRKEPSRTPSFEHAGVTLHSGDILISRGGAPTSALIARGNDYPGNFSHIALLYVDEATGTPSIIEAHIEQGVVISSFEEYLKDVKLRIMVMRVRSDHPLLVKDPMIPHHAAQMAYEEVKTRHIPYDFEMDFREPSKQFCSEVASHAYSSFGVTIWNILTTMSSPGVVKWLADFGVRHFETQAPADLEYDPQLVVVAEWRDINALWDDHVDNAIIEAMLEGADRGDPLSYDWYLLAPARILKAYSMALNSAGGIGPVPEGMPALNAVKNQWLGKMHKQTKLGVIEAATAFEQTNGYRPPYWELVTMAQEAYASVKKSK